MSFDKWRKRWEIAQQHQTIAGRRLALKEAGLLTFMIPDAEDEGYYRKPVTRKKLGRDGKTNGQTEVVDWEAVAYFLDRGMLCGVIGNRDMALNEVTDSALWSWVVSNPISEDLYRKVEAGEPWPDLPDVSVAMAKAIEEGASLSPLSQVPATDRTVERTDNQPPAEEVPLHLQHATGIDNAIAAALTVVKTEDEAAQAAGSMNRLAELRLKADKAGKAIYQPLYKTYKDTLDLWSPPIARASAKEKLLNTAILTFRAAEKKRIEAEQAAVAIENERIAALNERMADRAIEARETETPEFIPEAVVPQAQAPVQATYRAPGQRAAVKEEEKWFLDEVTDYDAVYKHFKNNPVLQQTLKTIATAAVKLGQTVPGTKTHKGLV